MKSSSSPAAYDEGVDHAGEVGRRGRVQHLNPEFRHERTRLLAAEQEQGRDHVDREVVVKHVEAGAPGQCIRDGELTNPRRSVQNDQFHRFAFFT